MAGPKTDEEKAIRELPLAQILHSKVKIPLDLDPLYVDNRLREQAERFATNVYFRAAREEYLFLMHPEDPDRAKVARFEEAFVEKGVSYPKFDSPTSPEFSGMLENSRLCVRAFVRKAHYDSARLFSAMFGPGTDEAKIFEVIDEYRGVSDAQRNLLLTVYRNRYKHSLDGALRAELSEWEYKRASPLVTGSGYAESDALALFDIFRRFRDKELSNEVSKFYRSRTTDEILEFEQLLNTKYQGGLAELMKLRLQAPLGKTEVSVASFLQHFASKTTSILAEALRKDDRDLLRVIESRISLTEPSPASLPFFYHMFDTPVNIPRFHSLYIDLLRKHGIEASLENDIKAAFPKIASRKSADNVIRKMLSGYPRDFMVAWVDSLNSDLKDVSTLREMLRIGGLVRSFGNSLTFANIAPTLERIGNESAKGFSPSLFKAILESGRNEELDEALLIECATLGETPRKQLRENLLRDIPEKTLVDKIRKRFDSNIAATLISDILGIHTPTSTPYDTNIGGPLAFAWRERSIEAKLHEDFKKYLPDKDPAFLTYFGHRRKASLEFLLGVYRDQHVVDLREFSSRFSRDATVIFTSVPIGASLVATRGAATPTVAAASRAAVQPLVKGMARMLAGTIVSTGLTYAQRKLFEGDLYQMSAQELTQFIRLVAMSIAVRLTPAALGSLGTNLHRYGQSLRARNVPPAAANRLMKKKVAQPSFWEQTPGVVKAAVVGGTGGLGAGLVNAAFGATPEEVVFDVIVGMGFTVVPAWSKEKIAEIKSRPPPVTVTRREVGSRTPMKLSEKSRESSTAESSAPTGVSAPADASPTTGAAPVAHVEHAAGTAAAVIPGENGTLTGRRVREPKPPRFARTAAATPARTPTQTSKGNGVEQRSNSGSGEQHPPEKGTGSVSDSKAVDPTQPDKQPSPPPVNGLPATTEPPVTSATSPAATPPQTPISAAVPAPVTSVSPTRTQPRIQIPAELSPPQIHLSITYGGALSPRELTAALNTCGYREIGRTAGAGQAPGTIHYSNGIRQINVPDISRIDSLTVELTARRMGLSPTEFKIARTGMVPDGYRDAVRAANSRSSASPQKPPVQNPPR